MAPSLINVFARSAQAYTLLGCYQDQATTRTLGAKEWDDYGSLTIDACASRCSSFKYFGVENGGECWCDDDIYTNAVMDTTGTLCVTPCDGDNTNTCGGSWGIDVYTNDAWTGSVDNPNHVRRALFEYTVGSYSLVGCSQSASYTYASTTTMSPATLEDCQQYCQPTAGSFAVSGTTCYCGLSASNNQIPASCTTACADNSTEICGGQNAVVAYVDSNWVAPPTPKAAVGPYQFVACTKTASVISVSSSILTNVTLEACQAACQPTSGSFGVSVDTCLCGVAPPQGHNTQQGTCNLFCTGDATENCGGSDSLVWYYDLTWTAPPPTPKVNVGNYAFQSCVASADVSTYTSYTLLSNNTLEACQTACQTTSNNFAVTGTHCYCGVVLSSQTSGTCDVTCNDDPTENCGGASSAVYYNYTAPTPEANVGNYVFQSCVATSAASSVGSFAVLANITLEACQTICEPNYSNFGVTADYCYCGLGFSSQTTGTCDLACPGDTTENCGDTNSFVYYSDPNWAAPPPPPPTPKANVGNYAFQDCLVEGGVYAASANTLANVTLESCMQMCLPTQSSFAVTYSTCYCGVTIFISETGTCDATCAGDTTENCGGTNSVVYYSDPNWVAPPPTPKANVGAYAFQDCLMTGTLAGPPDYVQTLTTVTLEACMQICLPTQSTFAVTGSTCYCGVTVVIPATGTCDVTCTDDTTENCGGTSSFVYYSDPNWVAPPPTPKANVGDYAFQSCTNNGALNFVSFTSLATATLEACRDTCQPTQGSFALSGSQCYCGISIPNPDAGTCDSQCVGDTTENCGGQMSAVVYNDPNWVAPPPTPKANVGDYAFQSCTNNGALNFVSFTSLTTVTLEACRDACQPTQGSFALSGSQCYCGISIPNPDAGTCDSQCVGDTTENCGGQMSAVVYNDPNWVAPSTPPTPKTTVGDYTHTGCIPNSDFTSASNSVLTTVTLEKCQEVCQPTAGSFGVSGTTCYCGITVTYPAGGTCDMTCADDPTENCGGSASSVLYNDPNWVAPPPTVGDFTYEGCYTDLIPQRVITSLRTVSDQMTPLLCSQTCAAYSWFGVEYSTECYCGFSLDTKSVKVSEASCNMKCGGDSTQTCGGPALINVYNNEDFTGPTAPSDPATVGSYALQGCYTDLTPGRVLLVSKGANPAMTVEMCASLCAEYAYFGVEYGDECYCGNDKGNSAKAADTACTMPCAGKALEICGGPALLNLYYDATLTPPTTPKPADVGNYAYQGCYPDLQPGRDFTALAFKEEDMSPSKCASLCADYPWFGVEYADECYCGTAAPGTTLVSDDHCNMACAGQPASMCGGPALLNVYNDPTFTGPAGPTPPTAPGSISPFTFAGCHTDLTSDGRVLTAKSTKDPAMTLEMCATFCAGYSYFGTEYSDECYCGYVLDATSDRTTNDEGCTMPCAGQPTEVCGGPSLLTLYFNPAAQGPHIVRQVQGFEYLHCQSDDPANRSLTAARYAQAGMTVETCGALCANYSYFGVEYADECYCGNGPVGGATISDSQCSMTCAGDDTEFCGGPNALSFYGSLP